MLLTIIIFLIILSVLVLVHELGHFLTAKSFGVRVDEFGLGYPPRAKTLFSSKGTVFTLNWLPFGGFVKIFGEDPSQDSAGQPDALTSRPKWQQAAVLVAGVLANALLAWVLFTGAFLIGVPSAPSPDYEVTNLHTNVTDTVAGSPADLAGLVSGDEIVSVGRGNIFANLDPEQISNFIASSKEPVKITVLRAGQKITDTITPVSGLVPDRLAVGVSLSSVGTAKLGLLAAIKEGAVDTWRLTQEIVVGLAGFLKNIFVGHPDFSEVTGPVGIVGLVGQAKDLGFAYILFFSAFISINLAVLNLLPIPALDGGRLLFVIIEAVSRKKIPSKIVNTLNGLSFAVLILLMILVTIRDVVHLL
jgi:regulator of sigma E protease